MGKLKTGQVNYDIVLSPNPVKIVTKLSFSTKNELQVTVTDVPGLGLKLKPKFSWNPVNDLLSAIGSIANAFQGKIVDFLKSKIKGMKITVYTVPDIKVNHSGVKLNFVPSKLKATNEQGYLMVSGEYKIK